MVLIASFKAFFESSTKMEIPHETRIQLKCEFVEIRKDLVDFNDDSISMISNTLRRLGVGVPDLAHVSVVGATIPTPHFTFGVKH